MFNFITLTITCTIAKDDSYKLLLDVHKLSGSENVSIERRICD